MNGLDQRRSPPAPSTHSARAEFDRHEFLNTVTHATGIALSVAAAIVLEYYALASGDNWRVVGCAVFGMALVCVYVASTLSHCVVELEWRTFFRRLDQALIYTLIAGSYTPFALLYLRDAWEWWLFLALMWILALWGFTAKMFIVRRSDAVLLPTYLIMGWLPILPAAEYVAYVPFGALAWVLAGGLCYSFGAVFLFVDSKRFYFHAIWHVFVIAGSTCHFFGVLIYVALAPAAAVV
jgi:hemolysin III